MIGAPPDAELLTLESEALRVRMWPRMGGKLVSLVVRGHAGQADSADRELLHAPIHAYNTPTGTSGFEHSDAGGWDECLPTVAACSSNGVQLADHGDLWRRPWDAQIKHDAILAHVNASSLPLRFSRFLSLDGPTMHLRYTVANTGSQPVDFLWSAHPLFQVQQGDRIVLPASVHKVQVQATSMRGLAQADGCCSWPIADVGNGTLVDLSIVGAPDGVTAHKLFTGPSSVGWCGIYRAQLKLGILIRFDEALTPYAGLWISQSAWPPGTDGPRQYTVALEPTTAPCDALDRARKLGAAHHLMPQGEFAWPMQCEIYGSHTPVSFDDFLHQVGIAPRH